MNKDKNNWASSFFIITLVVGFFTWASIFKVDENVRATGHVVTNDRTQVIQVADGGVLKKLNILEGDKVRKGDTLAMLENTRAEAERDSILAEIANLKIARSRASAESKDVEPNFSEFIDRYPDAVAAQKELFNSNKAALESRVR
ncbi:MAG: biotin/lipoyl-binding protein [Rhodobacteraceae bacterium]|nr:biotin/lipoyl-binding protein [Paracoccaceae bacterium]